jgi:hypothetical protein
MRQSHNITGSDLISRRRPPPGHGATSSFGVSRRRRFRPAALIGIVGLGALIAAGVALKSLL